MTDATRNALVSVFLRKLEYFEGVLFLTTNRVKTIDEAIASRIHLPLRYVELEQSARKELWKSFLMAGRATKKGAPLTPKDFERLSKKELNGREVRESCLDEVLLIESSFRSRMLCRSRKRWPIMKRARCDYRTSRRLLTSISSFSWIFVARVRWKTGTRICELFVLLAAALCSILRCKSSFRDSNADST